jgi:hypothetical protein
VLAYRFASWLFDLTSVQKKIDAISADYNLDATF